MSNCDVLGKSLSLGPSFLISNKLSDSLTSIYSHFLNQISEQSFLPDKEPESKLFKAVGPSSEVLCHKINLHPYLNGMLDYLNGQLKECFNKLLDFPGQLFFQQI